MNNIIDNPNDTKVRLNHSILGIISTILAFIPILVAIVIAAVSLIIEKSRPYNPEVDRLGEFISFIISIFLFGLLAFSVGSVISVVGLTQKNKMKLFLYVGLVLNVVMLMICTFIGKRFFIG
jgi:hypothetical protein